VSVVAIEPNDPKAITIDELDSSDISDSLEEMKIRAEYKHLSDPYLCDGETQSVTDAYGPQATPHAFVFDRDRRLRFERPHGQWLPLRDGNDSQGARRD
jgi:hypothetical protein